MERAPAFVEPLQWARGTARSGPEHSSLTAALSLSESIGAIFGAVLGNSHLSDEQRRDELYSTRTYLVERVHKEVCSSS